MAAMDELLNTAKQHLRTTPKNKLYIYLLLFVLAVGGSVVGLTLLQKENYQTLFSGLSTEDASMVVAKLKEQKVSYQLGAGGTSILVPRDKVYDTRLALASQNSLPGTGGVGFELFDKTNYGMTEFMQNVNYKRAISGELTRTINQMPEVKGSRVHIAIPEKSIFADRERDVTASVFLKLKPGRGLSKGQVSGIVHLVAGSIEGLRSENVSVIDSSGRILYKSGDGNSPIVATGQHYELQRSVERKIEESVQSMLDHFLPSSKSIVRASVEINLRKIEKVEEEFYPEKTALTGQKMSKERLANKSLLKPGGVPGVASNIKSVVAGRDDTMKEVQDKANESEREEAHNTYEVSKTVSKIVEPFGDVKRISLALVVDGKYEKVKGQKKSEELKYIPRSQKEISDIKNLVARAIGYDEERGDKIEVVNIPFETEIVVEEKGFLKGADTKDAIFGAGKYAFYTIILLAVFFFIVKPLMGILKQKEVSTPLNQIRDMYVGASPAADMANLSAGATAHGLPPAVDGSSMLMNALQDKDLVKAIIKEWVKERTL